MKNEGKKNSKLLIIILIIIIIILGGYLVYDKVLTKNTSSDNELKEDNTSTTENNCPKDEIKKQIVAINNSNEDYYKVELTSNGDVIVNATNIVNKTVANNIIKAVRLKVGQTDTCGKEIIALISETNTLTAFNLSDFYCYSDSTKSPSNVSYYNNLDQLSDVLDIYNEVEFVNTLEPLKYIINIQDSKGNVKDITSYFN